MMDDVSRGIMLLCSNWQVPPSLIGVRSIAHFNGQDGIQMAKEEEIQ